jgi:hypothetical protein
MQSVFALLDALISPPRPPIEPLPPLRRNEEKERSVTLYRGRFFFVAAAAAAAGRWVASQEVTLLTSSSELFGRRHPKCTQESSSA